MGVYFIGHQSHWKKVFVTNIFVENRSMDTCLHLLTQVLRCFHFLLKTYVDFKYIQNQLYFVENWGNYVQSPVYLYGWICDKN